MIVCLDGNPDQQATLCKLNVYLGCVEVWTFDQLQRVAGRVLQVFEVATGISEASPETANLVFEESPVFLDLSLTPALMQTVLLRGFRTWRLNGIRLSNPCRFTDSRCHQVA